MYHSAIHFLWSLKGCFWVWTALVCHVCMYVLWALFWQGGVQKNILLYDTIALNLSFASLHKKMLVSFCMVWFIFSPVCAFLKTHFFQDDVAITWLSSWWCIKVCVWIIFMTCKCCTYSDDLYSCAIRHSFSDTMTFYTVLSRKTW